MALEKDSRFALAERYVQETSVSVFLTGKAGTGKTTFLKEIVENTTKRCAVVAPTGIAAINAGGVTIHSFFQLPLCPYLPDVKELITEYQMPEKSWTLRKERVNILRTLDLLIIDEISMVRADIMDAMDYILRRYRRNEKPFGGVQLLMIGDIQQLPPVVKDVERRYMEQVYPSPFFFNSKALQKIPYIVVELEKIHRQSDRMFLNILNQIRSGNPSHQALELLNTRLDPGFIPPSDEKWIRLTTHNAMADEVNARKMTELEGEEKEYAADISGNFPENAYPADTTLRLKKGAQVMFIRNDASGKGQYYNGKIATVESVDPYIIVKDEEGNSIVVQKETWMNIRYELDEEDNEIKGFEDGSFEQYPLRLAWAITIHKSQGLTFDRVIIDAGKAFSFGQVYVALSRCRTLEGIVLVTPITSRCTFANNEVNIFESGYTPAEEAQNQLQARIQEFHAQCACEAFDLDTLRYLYNRVNRVFQVKLSNQFPIEASAFNAMGSGKDSMVGFRSLADTSKKFQAQIRHICATAANPSEDAFLKERMLKASEYFVTELSKLAVELSSLLVEDIGNKATKMEFRSAAEELVKELRFRMELYSKIQRDGFSIEVLGKLRTDKEVSDTMTLKAMTRSLAPAKKKGSRKRKPED